MSEPPILLGKARDLDEAVRLVPSDRWATEFGFESGCRVEGSVGFGSGRLVTLAPARDTSALSHDHAFFVGWCADFEPCAFARVQSLDGMKYLVPGLILPDVRDRIYAVAVRGDTIDGEDLQFEANPTGVRSPGAVPASRWCDDGRTVEYENSVVLELLGKHGSSVVDTMAHLEHVGYGVGERLVASLSLRRPNRSEVTVFAALREVLSGTVHGPFAFRSELMSEPDTLVARARVLGGDLRTLHQALATDVGDDRCAFRSAELPDIDRWRLTLRSKATLVFDLLLRHQDRIQGEREVQLSARLSELHALAEQLATRVTGAAGHLARIHGALSLEKIHRLENGGFAFVGFGDPMVRGGDDGLETPLYDVAVLLRSLSRHLRGGQFTDDARGIEKHVRASFLNGYLGDSWEVENPESPPRLPPTLHRVLCLLQLLELDVALCDLHFALLGDHPLGGALSGVLDTLDGRSS